MKKSALNMLGVSSPMNQNNGKGEIKTWNEGEPNITGSSGLLGVIGGGGVKVLSKLWKTFTNAPKQYTKVITKPTTKAAAPNVTPTGANPRSRIYGEHVSPKGEALGSYQYRSTGFGGGGRVWEPTKKSVGKISNLDGPSGYYRSDAKGWPLPSNAASIEKAIKLKTFIKK